MRNTPYEGSGAVSRTWRRGRLAAAFSLVEMLAVIGVIGILGVAIGVGLSGGNSPGASMSNAQRMMAGMFQMARTQAIMKGEPTAVIIYAGDKSPDRYLRYVGIVSYGDIKNASGTVTGKGWYPISGGRALPKGVYFVPPDGTESGVFKDYPSSKNNYAKQQFSFPIQTQAAEDYHAYFFDSRGNLGEADASNGAKSSLTNTYLFFTPVRNKGGSSGGKPVLAYEEATLPEQMMGIAPRNRGGAFMLDFLSSSIITNLKTSNEAVVEEP